MLAIYIWWLVTLFYDLRGVISGILLLIFYIYLEKKIDTKKKILCIYLFYLLFFYNYIFIY
jgi:hypothetical protein